MARNSVFHCHLLPVGNQKMFLAIFFIYVVDSINVFDCHLSGVNMVGKTIRMAEQIIDPDKQFLLA